MCASASEISVDELVQTLKRTSLPTVIIEGADDVIVYRGIEQLTCGSGNYLSILPVGGREKVIELFRRRDEFSGKQVSYIADSDCWVLTGIPGELLDESLVFTHGYSIENDVLADEDFESLLFDVDKPVYRAELEKFIKWFSLTYSRHVAGASEGLHIGAHPNRILDNSESWEDLIALRDGEIFPVDIHKKISEDYKKYLRGKSLLAVLMRRLSYTGRVPRHHHLALLEMGASKRGAKVGAIYDRIKQNFQTQP